MFRRSRRERPDGDRSSRLSGQDAEGEQALGEGGRDGLNVTRRTALVGGAIGVGGLMGLGKISDASAALAAESAGAEVGAANLDTTAEQLHLTWGSDPAGDVTVSWSPTGAAPMRAPMLAFSTAPITAENPGELVFLPDPVPLSLAEPRTGPCATSFKDGQTGETTFHYHVPLTGLEPDTTYYYAVTDGAEEPTTVSASFRTAPAGRASYRFTAFGDQGLNPTSPYTTEGVADPGDGKGAPLFHLMVGDLAYADGNAPPPVWKNWLTMVSAAAKTFPWMPVMGNHEIERGVTNLSGEPQTEGTSGSYYNGPYGSGSYFSRFLLPDNGVVNWDGNHLQGSFYSFQIGTVLFISLAGNDVNWQTSDYSQTKPSQYTGKLAADPANMALVPTGATPNLQTQWLEQTLKAAREEGSGVEMIVVQMHFPFASVDTGNSCDMGVRAAWGPLFDEYEVDITLTGHNHNYCRSLPTRGFDPPSGVAQGSFTNPFGSYTAGQTVDTRRPSVRQTEPLEFEGEQAWDTSLGTVHLVVGGGGAASTIGETVDSSTGLVQAHPFVDPVNNVQAIEDAPWLGFYDTADAYGYAVFDVDPGDGPGQTSITFQWFQMPAEVNGTTVLPPTTPLEKFVFTRMSGQMTPGAPSIEGTVGVGRTVSANPGEWSASSVALSYQWLADGTPIGGATSQAYTIAAADQGKELQVRVTGELEGFEATSATSAGILVAGRRLQPSAVTVGGTFQVGGTVTAAASAWTPPADLTYQWLRDGAPIGGATGASYSPAAADAGRLLQVKVSGTAAGYQSASTVSAPQTVTGGAAADAAARVSVPTISGTPAVGVTVAAVLADGTGAKGLDYQWLRDGAPIAGATRSSYTPVPADAERLLQVRVDAGGGAAVSAATSVRAARFRASRPGLRGVAKVGRTISAVTGAWSPRPKFAYQWLLEGRPIAGATAETLHVKPAYAGRSVRLRITASRTGYETLETLSDAVEIDQGRLKSSTPKIKGKAKVGETLQIARGDWGDHRHFSYLWLVGGRPVAGRTVAGRAVTERSTGIAYKVRPEDRGKRITVRVSAYAPGFKTVTKTSAPTAPVRA
ncbi:MAG TPA: fibronectin type III domain-containing protein [Solirubrobacterales bacterium]|nr:fibronectin type III domain-containing protein [Solirubrobacterales bacterium]